ncbi:hypothetical protein [Clostridium saccharobutylicum]|uniref:Uncharacterized protein n=1 Tax=Clostridium saccharobutylicum DSM 13864 TaxID=1345695 RepID=U5MP23_CLOSA|nr:hypothetical protein [Clostridium saccharobutylicum]AGX42534.1 hypothetical protein CLSA_c15340 [Clostridium saccharobutylicum DSM 13864]MBA2906721.1 archaellum component FlaC [Clostridium saccharobutylicum]MBA8897960.1 archaellum component FlaC [Clostridium saccharobutylicum]MBA8981309.1 archaellum component FlaC [Clostridium saccharobutylicum]MBA8999576.1 archaellum component FlaC [Clostridium saccharobutylicum]
MIIFRGDGILTFDDNNELFDLMNKISSEINNKFDGIHFEITTMKCAISNLNNKIEKNNTILEQISKDLSLFTEHKKLLTEELIKNKQNSDTTILNDKLNNLENELTNLSTAISNLSVDSSHKMTTLSNDLNFITHKMQQAEKELFNIKNELKIID